MVAERGRRGTFLKRSREGLSAAPAAAAAAAVAALAVGLVLSLSVARAASIVGSKHNLSSSGPGTVKAVTESQICLFCHTPHNANPAAPLWSHTLSSQTYTLYTAETLQGTTGQPDGVSKLCLSCHDGTVALGSLGNPASRTIAMSGTAPDGTMPAGTSDLGTDLANDHPVSITVNLTDPEIVTPLAGDPVQLYANKVQCTSCHDPHDPQYGAVAGGPGKFLVKANDDGTYGSQLCLSCHSKAGWSSSAHRNATDLYNGRLGNLAVSRYACEACHRPHTATRPVWILDDNDGDAVTNNEGVCLRCHKSSGTMPGDQIWPIYYSGTGTTPIAGDYGYGHRLPNYETQHRPVRDGAGGTEAPVGTTIHVECTDCHNPHKTQVQPGLRARPVTGGNSVSTSKGQALLGLWVQPVTYPGGAPPLGSWNDGTFGSPREILYEYEGCFRCHNSTTMPTNERGNMVKYFNPNNMAHHAVVAPWSSANDAGSTPTNTAAFVNPSIKGSTIYCSDCHDPHATNRWLLKGEFDGATGGTGSRNYVCYNCHKKTVYGGAAATSDVQYSRFADHDQQAHFTPKGGKWPDWDGDGQPDVPYIGCLICHGNFKPGGGGIHGAHERNTATPGQRVDGNHFLNGFGMELVFTSAGPKRKFNCGGYYVSTSGVGCNQHTNLGKTNQVEQY